MARWIAADRGATALRLTLMQDDAPLATRKRADGVNALGSGDLEDALPALAGDWIAEIAAEGPVQIIACGLADMGPGRAGAPACRTVPCAPIGDAEGAPARVRTRDARLDLRLVPGLRQMAPHADVMRGGETRIAGLLRALPDFDGIVCLPGAHTRWAHVSAGEVVSFRTVMTGEIFGLLRDRSVLRDSVGGDAGKDGGEDGWDEEQFLGAVSATLSRPETLTSRLFELHAGDLLHGQEAGRARSVLSGLLIGAELGATKPWWMGREVVVTGSDAISRVYASALAAQGLAPRLLPGAGTMLAGLNAVRAAGAEADGSRPGAGERT